MDYKYYIDDLFPNKKFITEIVKEKGITDIILDYRKDLEYNEYLIFDDNDEIDWDEISWSKQRLPDDFIIYFADKLNWGRIIHNHHPMEHILRKCSKYFTEEIWDDISGHLILDVDFLEEFKDKINWDSLSYFGWITTEIIINFKDKLNIKNVLNNYHTHYIDYEEYKKLGLITQEDIDLHFEEMPYYPDTDEIEGDYEYETEEESESES